MERPLKNTPGVIEMPGHPLHGVRARFVRANAGGSNVVKLMEPWGSHVRDDLVTIGPGEWRRATAVEVEAQSDRDTGFTIGTVEEVEPSARLATCLRCLRSDVPTFLRGEKLRLARHDDKGRVCKGSNRAVSPLDGGR